MLPNEQPQPGPDVLRLMAVYEKIMLRYAWETPLDEIKLHFQELSPDELIMIGHVYLAMAHLKPSFHAPTPGVTRLTPDEAGDRGYSVSHPNEFAQGAKVPYLAPIGGGN